MYFMVHIFPMFGFVCVCFFLSLVVLLVTKNQMEKEYFIERNTLFTAFVIDHFGCAKSPYRFFVCNRNVPLNEILKELKIAKIHGMIFANHMSPLYADDVDDDDDDATKPHHLQ